MTKSTDLTTQALHVNRVQTHMPLFRTTGLKPNTNHNVYLDGELYNFAVKPFGKDLGAACTSDSNGSLIFYMLYEVEYNRGQNFEFDITQSINIDPTNNTENRVKNYRLIEVKSADGSSYAQFVMTVNLLLTAGPVRTLYPTE